MNIKTKLILAATAVSLLSTPAFAFRDMGDAGGDSAHILTLTAIIVLRPEMRIGVEHIQSAEQVNTTDRRVPFEAGQPNL